MINYDTFLILTAVRESWFSAVSELLFLQLNSFRSCAFKMLNSAQDFISCMLN